MRHRLIAIAFVLGLAPSALLAQAPSPPGQPETGPGGKEYPYASFTSALYGTGAMEYLLFEPADPLPESAPVVAFLHGWGAMDPAPYAAWIGHIVRRGAVVIYPRYQENLATPTSEFTPNAISTLRQALDRLATEPGHVRPEPGLFALAGHSEGGLLAANVAALARSSTWKLLDGLTDAAFYGTNRAYALGNTEEQQFMGLWSDGVPVTPLKVVLQP